MARNILAGTIEIASELASLGAFLTLIAVLTGAAS